MKIKVTALMLAFLTLAAVAVLSVKAEAADSDAGPGGYSDGAEGSNSGAGPGGYSDGAEGSNSNEGPGGYSDGAEGSNPSSSSGSGKRSSSGRSGQKKQVTIPTGEVVGVSAEACPVLITTYMREGQANDVEEVKTLQSFLNKDLKISLDVTGVFNSSTTKAVNDFQVKYKDSVLLPWVKAGLLGSVNEPTGYVYKTTQYTINTILCPELKIAKPII